MILTLLSINNNNINNNSSISSSINSSINSSSSRKNNHQKASTTALDLSRNEAHYHSLHQTQSFIQFKGKIEGVLNIIEKENNNVLLPSLSLLHDPQLMDEIVHYLGTQIVDTDNFDWFKISGFYWLLLIMQDISSTLP